MLKEETIDGFFGRVKITAEDLFLRFSTDVRTNRLVKRVIGLPGDIVEIKDNQVFIDYIPIKEDYIKGRTSGYRFSEKFTVPEGKIFVMGDNREESNDSRMFGFVDLGSLEGRVVFRYWPFKDFESFNQNSYY